MLYAFHFHVVADWMETAIDRIVFAKTPDDAWQQVSADIRAHHPPPAAKGHNCTRTWQPVTLH